MVYGGIHCKYIIDIMSNKEILNNKSMDKLFFNCPYVLPVHY